MQIFNSFFSLRIPLTSDTNEVRAATLRVLRHLIEDEEDAKELNRVNIHYLVARCLDIDLDNRLERTHAVRLARKILLLSPRQLSQTIVRSLVAIAQSGNDPKEPDRFHKCSLAVLCEMSILHPDLLIRCGGVPVLIHSLLDCSMPRISEAIIGSLLYLHNNPETRNAAKVQLDSIVSPFTGFRYIHSDKASAEAGQGGAASEAEHHFNCAHQAILSTLRSWTGILHLFRIIERSGGDVIVTSPMNSLVEVLNLNLPEKRVCRHLF